MTVPGTLQIFVFLALVALVAVGMGRYMYRVYEGLPTPLDPVLVPVERALYRIAGVDAGREMAWTEYAMALLAFNAVGFVVLYLLLRVQAWLPLNPQHLPDVPFWTAWNTAVSFVTNTNWQVYSGETTMSYLSQMWLATQQFLSPLTGMAIFLAFVRGLARQGTNTLGNFWRDVVRTLLWIALPGAMVGAVALVALGSPQTFQPPVHAVTLQGTGQTLVRGPVASMTAIMQWGDNGGGYFGANAAHPYEAPNVPSLVLQLLMGASVPAGCVELFGLMVRDRRQARALFAAMAILFAAGALVLYHAEAAGNPVLHSLGIAGPNMEGKEVRFGPALSSLFEASTTAVSWGSTAAANDSLTPIGGLVTLFNMMTGEVIFGSWGVGMVGMLAYAVLAVFLAGLMVGRTPEYLGKKIQAYEVKMAVLTMLVPALVILLFSAVSVSVRPGLAGIFNPGPHGLSEVLYAFSSGVGNNGSAFGGLQAASPWYAATMGVAMLFGRYAMYVPALAMAGSLARKQKIPPSAGTFPTHGGTFVVLLLATVTLVGALTFFPALALGPLAEQGAMVAGHTF